MTINVYQNGGKLFVGKAVNISKEPTKQKFFQELTSILAQNGAKKIISSRTKNDLLKNCSIKASKNCGINFR